MTANGAPTEAVQLFRRLVLACHRWVQDGVPSPRTALPSEVERWDRLVEASRRTALHGLVGWYFAHNSPADLPAPATDRLVQDFRSAQVSTAELQAAAQELARALAGRGVEAVFRKGVVVAGRYPDAGCRPFHDIDVFVARDDAPGAAAALALLGYSQEGLDRATHIYLLVSTNALPPFTRGGLTVDVATSLVMPRHEGPGSRRVYQELLDGAVVRGGLPQFDRVGALLDLATNVHQTHTTLKYVKARRFQRAVSYLDLELEAADFTDDDWASFDRMAAEAGLADATGFAFGNCGRLLGDESRLAHRARPVPLDEVGTWELPEPYTWREPLLERLLWDGLPPDLPRFRMTL